MTKRWRQRIPLLAASLAALLSCTSKAGPPPAAPAAVTQMTIGVSLLTRTHPFYQDLEAGLTAAAEERGWKLIIASGEFDVARQMDQLAGFLVKGVDAIVVCPCDSKSIGTSIQAANAAGVPVFTADIACTAEGARVVTHIASDNVDGGRMAAKAMVEAIGGQGKVAIIDHPEVESVIQRVAGFEEEIGKAEGITIVSKLPGGGVKDKAFRVAEDLLQAHPDLAGIFGINDDSALGALAAVEKSGKSGQVKIVGFDAVPEARAAIGAGKIYADTIQNPTMIGQVTIESIASYMAGEEMPPQVLIPCGIFTKADAEAAGDGGDGK